jgi:predicted DNA-binding ribbon-helix-helix protein
MKKRSVTIAGHATSVSLEDEFWQELKNIADARGASLNDLIAAVDENKNEANLSSALRLFVLKTLQDRR